MADFVYNRSKGRVSEFGERVNDYSSLNRNLKTWSNPLKMPDAGWKIKPHGCKCAACMTKK